jgi:hypothetical protein
MWYRAGADLVVVVHLLFICFVVVGVFVTWRWPLIIWAHIPAVIYAALVEFAGFTCPLTLLENDFRQRAGDAGYRDGFIAHYLVKVIYPPGLTHGMQIGLGVLLLVAIIGYWGFLRRQGRGAARAWPIARGRNMGRAPPPAGGAAVASAPSVSCTRTQGDSAIEGSLCGICCRLEAGLPGEGEDPLGDNIGLVQLVQVPARDGRGGPTEGQSGGPNFGIGVAEGEVGAGVAVPVHRQTDGRPQVADGDAWGLFLDAATGIGIGIEAA